MQRDLDSGIYSDIELPEATNPTASSFASKMDTILGLSSTGNSDPQYVLLEQHVHLDIPDDETEEGEFAPYIVTIEEQYKTNIKYS